MIENKNTYFFDIDIDLRTIDTKEITGQILLNGKEIPKPILKPIKKCKTNN